ncbi:MAG: LCP family protein [Anaerolineae bacterium]
MSQPRVTREPAPSRGSILVAILSILLLATAAYTSYLVYQAVRDVVAHSSELPSLPQVRLPVRRVQPAEVTGNVPSSGDQPPLISFLAPRPEPQPVPRCINILVLGIDQRRGEQGPYRTDTMILVSVDPARKQVGMLSIPRDLYVTIPGYGENRINMANFIGDRDKYPGGGPALAKRTLEYNYGVRVDFYIRVNFDGFERIIDTIGGVDILVEKEIRDDTFPDEHYGYDPLYIPAGLIHMDGKLALKYARTRHGDSDIYRARRQQQVILAVKDKITQMNLAPSLLLKLPELMRTFSDSVETDIPVDQAIQLAQMAMEWDLSTVETAVIDDSMTVRHFTETGADVLLPLNDKVRALMEQMFGEGEASTPTAPVATPQEMDQALQEARRQADAQSRQAALQQRLAADGARIIVLNGTGRPDLAPQVADYLKNMGLHVVAFGDADRSDYAQTVLVDYTGKEFTVSQLVGLFQVRPENVRRSPVLKDEVDVRLIVGADFQWPTASARPGLP